MRNKVCPKCGTDISHTFTAYDPENGIMQTYWYCEDCKLPVTEEDPQITMECDEK
jgi:hypothetical protein